MTRIKKITLAALVALALAASAVATSPSVQTVARGYNGTIPGPIAKANVQDLSIT